MGRRKKTLPDPEPTILEMNGIGAYIARRCHTSSTNVCRILRGGILASPEMAAKMEEVFIELGLPLTRWDLLYGIGPEETLIEYARKRFATLGIKRMVPRYIPTAARHE